jgi:hypothetical protein
VSLRFGRGGGPKALIDKLRLSPHSHEGQYKRAIVLSVDKKSHVWMAPARKRKGSVWHNAIALWSCVRPVDAVVA